MSALYSNRLEKRNFELDFNNRLNYEDYPEIGEITGDQFAYNDIDKGMPVRGNFTPNKNDKKNTYDNNNNLDFDLFEKKSNFKINYFDPFNTNDNFNNIANLDNFRDSNKIISDDIDKMSNTIDNYGYFLFNTVQKYLLKNHYLISSFYLNTILSSFFIASKNKTLSLLTLTYTGICFFLPTPPTPISLSLFFKKIPSGIKLSFPLEPMIRKSNPSSSNFGRLSSNVS
jgi:hypothetical protein